MLRHNQFTFGSILGLMAIVAALLVGGELTTIAVIEIVFCYFVIEVLMRNLPRGIEKSIRFNSKRQNGSWSSRRAQIEREAVLKVRRDLSITLATIVLVTNAMVWMFNSEVIPISIGMNVLSEVGSTEFRANIESEEARFEKWAWRKSISDVDGRKRILAQFWPYILACVLMWFVGCFLILKASYFYSLRQLADSIEHRRALYRWRDLTELDPHQRDLDDSRVKAI